HNEFSLREGDFISRIARLRLNIFFTPDISWTTFAQYDNDSDTLGINSRFRWIVSDGREFFLVFNQSLVDRGDGLERGRSEALAKLGWTFRY
ncbi:MAG: hypothetical protein V3T33_08725, partial [Myxococcota bacterium]